MSKIVQDSKLEYSWKDIELARETGYKNCKDKVLEIIKKSKYLSNGIEIHYQENESRFWETVREIENL